ncbi:hypothetical protein PV327_007664 [Microctonus hyperodae]|uniref:Myosin motor domain-containing protein n=1 Tax=Microctonus hyperodae TaxID=165561 RepID=A0AA39G0D3_MICHY|nr:hypothetical protein PV327_007664 [Microctonus hyperodae]
MQYNQIRIDSCSKPSLENFIDRITYRMTEEISKRNQTIIILGEADSETLNNLLEINNYLLTRFSDDLHERLEKQNVEKIHSVVSLITTLSAAHNDNVGYKDYSMVHGMSNEEMQELRLSKNTEYNIIEYKYMTFNEEHYIMRLKNMIATMKMIEITENEIKEAFKILALILHMGNIKFITNINECSIDFNDDRSKNAVMNICYLLNISKSQFVKLFKYSSIKSMKSKRKIFSGENFCRSQLYGMMTNIYELLFNWIVTKTNEYFKSRMNAEVETWLGVLHIPEFQYISECNMEEFCTNYVAERMHLYFKEKYLEAEWKDYTDEGLITQPINFYVPGSKCTVEVIENTVMRAFDNICSTSILPTSENMMKELFKERNTSGVIKKYNEDKFCIRHYVDPVHYSCSDMMNKNIGKLPKNFIALIKSECKNKLLKNLVKNLKDDTAKSNDSECCTTLSKLKKNLDNLLAEVGATDSYYLRCYKLQHDEDEERYIPNDNSVDDLKAQFYFSELDNMISLARTGYLIKMTHDEYKNRYVFREPNMENLKAMLANEAFDCEKILKSHRFIGTNIIFLSEECFFKLEYYRERYFHLLAEKRRIHEFYQRGNRRVTLASSNNRVTRSSVNRLNELSEIERDRSRSFVRPNLNIHNCIESFEMDNDD